MGSRFSGYIEPGSMPALHRYLGTPATTGVLNLIYATRFTDIHCGMRGITRDALVRIDCLRNPGSTPRNWSSNPSRCSCGRRKFPYGF